MSQKNETTILLLALLLTLGLVGIGAWVVKKFIFQDNVPATSSTTIVESSSTAVKEQISFGEKSLFSVTSPAKRSGIEAIAANKWSNAVTNLQQALKENPNEPETLIFLNHAKIAGQKSYTIAVVVPSGTDPNGSLEILRGVAQAQNEINAAGGIGGVPLKVAIANDNNQEDGAKKIATTLVNNSQVLGVIGHWASQATLAAAPIYTGKLVAISPISTSVISGFSPYIFRTVPL